MKNAIKLLMLVQVVFLFLNLTDTKAQCDSEAGQMGSELKSVCYGDDVNAPAEGVVISPGDSHLYLLHDGTGTFIYGASLDGHFFKDDIYPLQVRDNDENPLMNQTVCIKLTVHQGSPFGPVVYQENFLKLTNSVGLVDLILGNGTVVSGSLEGIDLTIDPYFLGTGVDVSGTCSNFDGYSLKQMLESRYYKVLVTDVAGNPVLNQAMCIQLIYYQGSPSGEIVYQENYPQNVSNSIGLIDLLLGNGIVISGAYENIDFNSDSYYLDIRIDLSASCGNFNYSLGAFQIPYTNTQLYISSVVGPPGTDGVPALNTLCTDIVLPGCPVIFYDSFSSCGNTTNVYPGDKNNDGIVDQKDVAIAGYLYETGPARAPEHLNIEWYAHPAQDWDDNLPFNGANIKHLDCNGDGTISTGDANAVIQNLGLTHDEGGNQFGTFDFENTNYQIYLQPVDDLDNDNLLEVNVVLENKNGNNLNLQGGYFTIDYNNVNTNITNAAMNFTNSWLGSPGINMIESYSNFPNFQQIEIGFSKTDGTNSTGKGVIGQLTFLLDNNAARSANDLLDFEVIEIGVHDMQGNIQPIEEQFLQVGLSESNCQSNWNITEDSPFYNVYKSNGTIETDGFVLIGKEQQVNYTANRVRLNEGFSVRVGASFKVRSNGCN